MQNSIYRVQQTVKLALFSQYNNEFGLHFDITSWGVMNGLSPGPSLPMEPRHDCTVCFGIRSSSCILNLSVSAMMDRTDFSSQYNTPRHVKSRKAGVLIRTP